MRIDRTIEGAPRYFQARAPLLTSLGEIDFTVPMFDDFLRRAML